jgi:hypothetical protein
MHCLVHVPVIGALHVGLAHNLLDCLVLCLKPFCTKVAWCPMLDDVVCQVLQ